MLTAISHSRYFIFKHLENDGVQYRTKNDCCYIFERAVLCSDLESTKERLEQLKKIYVDSELKIGKVHVIFDQELVN